jgi:hypothetical protein
METLPQGFLHIHHDSVPLFMLQVLMSHNTCSSELPSEKVEFRFIFVGIVSRGWIMHAWKGVSIVFSCEVCHLLGTICLSNGSFNFVFFYITYEWPLVPFQLNSTNGHVQAPHLCLIREVQNHVLHWIYWKNQVDRSSITYKATPEPHLPVF